MKELMERIVRNWRTSSVAIIALIVLVGGWFGFETSGAQISTVIVGLQAIVLLFAKDK